MSHEIVYDRQFIKVSNNRILPIAYYGSSNCTEIGPSGVERRVRDWQTMGVHGLCTPEEFKQYWQDSRDSFVEHSRQDWPYNDGKFMSHIATRIGNKDSYKDFTNWINTSIAKAITVEQLAELGKGITIIAQHSWDGKKVVEGYDNVKMTVYTEADFLELYKLKISYSTFIMRIGGSDNLAVNARKRFFPIVKKEKQIIELDKYFTIYVEGLGYLSKHTSRGLKYNSFPKKQYATEKQAQKLVDKYNEKYGSRTYTVEQINEPTRVIACV